MQMCQNDHISPLFKGPDIDAHSCIRYAAHISVVMCTRITHLKTDQPGGTSSRDNGTYRISYILSSAEFFQN